MASYIADVARSSPAAHTRAGPRDSWAAPTALVPSSQAGAGGRLPTLVEAVEAVETDLLTRALTATRGVRAQAARLLGTTERIFNYKVRKYRIDWRRFRDAGNSGGEKEGEAHGTPHP